jgi:cyclic pyranopterin monophosphate synthase
MVDVSEKAVTDRTAVASAVVTMRADVLQMLLAGSLGKGEAITTAKIAGISAAKQTGSLIPLCHPLSLEWVKVDIEPADDTSLRIMATARTVGRTGVEMEALTAASVAALTIYDMAKAADRTMVIGPIQLESKSGGKSGPYERA